MIKPLILFLAATYFAVSVQSQQSVADSIPINKDSLEKEIDDFLKLFDSLKQPKSYFLVGLGVSNQQFSVNNTALNALQTNVGINFVPTLAYNHKSGLGISYSNYINVSGSNVTLFQHTITPSYTYTTGKVMGFGISYTRYFSAGASPNLSSPYKNDIYTYAEVQKWKYKPSIALGFANGKFRETSVRDSLIKNPSQSGPDSLRIKYFDTLNFKLRDFSFITSLRREFNWKGFSKKDQITFTPSILFLFGVSNYEVEYISKPQAGPRLQQVLNNNPLLLRRVSSEGGILQRSRGFISEPGKFNLQSLGLNLDATWYIGKFYFNPQFYFDYYLLSSKNKFNVLYTVQAGFMF
jgi:hypothetical protein